MLRKITTVIFILLVCKFLPAKSYNSGHLNYRFSKQTESVISDMDRHFQKILNHTQNRLGIRLNDEVKIYVLTGSEQEKEFNLDKKGIPEWFGGYVNYPGSVMVLRTTRPGRSRTGKSVYQIFSHEITHVLIAQNFSSDNVPRWLNEGIAMIEAGDWNFKDYYHFARHLISDHYIPLKKLRRRFPKNRDDVYMAYLESYTFTSKLLDKYGDNAIQRLFGYLKRGKNFEEAFKKVTGKSVQEFESDLKGKLALYYKWIPLLTSSITLWIGLTFLAIFAYFWKKKRNQAVIERWEEEEEKFGNKF